jgi:hypothetical protein
MCILPLAGLLRMITYPVIFASVCDRLGVSNTRRLSHDGSLRKAEITCSVFFAQ